MEKEKIWITVVVKFSAPLQRGSAILCSKFYPFPTFGTPSELRVGEGVNMNKKLSTLIFTVLTLVLVSGSLAGCSSMAATEESNMATSNITDMYGRSLEVPVEIDRVLCSGSIEMMMTYMVAPDKLCGWCFEPSGTLIAPNYMTLPVVGGWFGKQSGNYETFIALEPDIIIEGREEALNERQEKFGGIPVIGLQTGTSLLDYRSSFDCLGELLGVSDTVTELIAFYEEALNFADSFRKQIPESERVTVYYAEGNKGLNTDPAGSAHTELIDLCGGENVADIGVTEGYGMAEVSMEQVLMWDPDIIIIGRASQASLRDLIMTDTRWQELKAVRDGKVYVRPEDPFSWFDGPTGPNQIIGIYWMVQKLYPDRYSEQELQEKGREFYHLFYHYDLSDEELSLLLGNG